MHGKRPALGKGLSALIPDAPEPPRRSPTRSRHRSPRRPNDFQPRATSTMRGSRSSRSRSSSNGVIQPIVVRRDGDRFQIIAGERRWRAAQARRPAARAGRRARRRGGPGTVAARDGAHREHPARKSNPIDEALAYRRLTDEFHLTQEEIATAVGKDRASVANFLRLLKLPDEVQSEVASGTLSMGHARALLALADEAEQRRVARDVIARSLSVRETESLVKKIVEGAQPPRSRAARSRSTSTRAPPKIGSARSSARASASSARARAAASRSISGPRTS